MSREIKFDLSSLNKNPIARTEPPISSGYLKGLLY